jgi:hypothetical protein
MQVQSLKSTQPGVEGPIVNIGLTAIGGAANWIMCTRKGSGGSVRRGRRYSSYQICCRGGADSMPQESVVLSAWVGGHACCLLLDRARMQRIVWPRPAARQLAVLGMAGGWRTGNSDGLTTEPTSRVRLTQLVQPLSTPSSFGLSATAPRLRLTSTRDRGVGRTKRIRHARRAWLIWRPAISTNRRPVHAGYWHVLLIHRQVGDSKDIQHGPEDAPLGW